MRPKIIGAISLTARDASQDRKPVSGSETGPVAFSDNFRTDPRPNAQWITPTGAFRRVRRAISRLHENRPNSPLDSNRKLQYYNYKLLYDAR
jgi:hypothetical protein